MSRPDDEKEDAFHFVVSPKPACRATRRISTEGSLGQLLFAVWSVSPSRIRACIVCFGFFKLESKFDSVVTQLHRGAVTIATLLSGIYARVPREVIGKESRAEKTIAFAHQENRHARTQAVLQCTRLPRTQAVLRCSRIPRTQAVLPCSRVPPWPARATFRTGGGYTNWTDFSKVRSITVRQMATPCCTLTAYGGVVATRFV